MRRIYDAHLLTTTAIAEFDELVRLVADGPPVCLLCYERHADHCHRRILVERLAGRLDLDVVDLTP